jgi:CheY-like chemotaxis protein/PAS domain-containing protein
MDRHPDSPSALERALLDAISDVNGGAMLVVDGDDLVLYASPQMILLFDIPDFYLAAGTRLRDFLGAIYDHCLRATVSPAPASRESWLSERVAAHWRERLDVTDYTSKKRAVRSVMRRMSSGLGVCILTDVTEQKKREDLWRADLERVKITEDILNSLPQPLVVLDEQLKIAATNTAFAAMVQHSEDHLMEMPASAVLAPAFVAQLQIAAKEAQNKAGVIAITNPDLSDKTQNNKPVAYLHKVGKTGRSFLVLTFTQILTARHDTSIVRLPHAATRVVQPQSPPRSNPKSAIKQTAETIVIVTSDAQFEREALRALQPRNTDHCIVRNQAELQAFLNLTETIDITIDLAIIDSALPTTTSAAAQGKARSVVVIDRHHIAKALDHQINTPQIKRSILNAAKKPERLAALPAKPAQDNLEILVVEDNEVNQIVFSQILEGLGCRYRLATNAAEALSIWQSEKPPVVLMDISLPDMNGMDVCRLMRRKENNGQPRSLIVGVLVPAFDHDRPRCLEAGMDDVIVKPLSPDMIEQLLRRHLIGQWAEKGAAS